jgi:hypothetical protein
LAARFVAVGIPGVAAVSSVGTFMRAGRSETSRSLQRSPSPDEFSIPTACW